MPFPESSRVVFEENPLAEVICQLRFPTILEIASEEPAAFQKHIRADYPFYEREEGEIRMNLPADVSKGIIDTFPQLSGVKQPERVIHKFVTEDSSRLISLNREFLAVTENHYERWEHFEEEILRAKNIVEEIYGPAFYTRIGLRYRDVIDRAVLGLEETPWNALINQFLIGVLGEEVIQNQVEKISSTALIKIGDSQDGRVTLRHGLASHENRQVYVIDTDFFTENRSSRDEVPEKLRRFNRLAGNLFRWAITSVLRDALKPKTID